MIQTDKKRAVLNCGKLMKSWLALFFCSEAEGDIHIDRLKAQIHRDEEWARPGICPASTRRLQPHTEAFHHHFRAVLYHRHGKAAEIE